MKRSNKGITIIEVMIIVAIIVILAALAIPPLMGIKPKKVSEQSVEIAYVIEGMVETKCLGGYRFIVSNQSTQQVKDQNGNGIPCGNNTSQELVDTLE